MTEVCFTAQDNRHRNSPAKMSDGRLLTDYKSPCIVDTRIQRNNGISNSEEYRQFLIQNATKIMDLNNRYFRHVGGLGACDN